MSDQDEIRKLRSDVLNMCALARQWAEVAKQESKPNSGRYQKADDDLAFIKQTRERYQ